MQKWEKFSEEELKEMFYSSKTATEFANKLGYKSRKVVSQIKTKYSWCSFKSKNNLAGRRFGKLVVEEATNERKRECIIWKCRCDCGNICYVDTSTLNSGNKQSCGCLWKERVHEANFQDLTNQKFGHLTPISWERNEQKDIYWNCKCDCGNEVKVKAGNLKSGQIQSCGCLQAETIRKLCLIDMTNQKFGKLTAIEPTNKKSGNNVIWKCQCDCGKITYVDGYALRTGHTKSCGCIGSSYYEKVIGTILDELNISYIKEYSFEDLFGDTNKLRFDYAIFNNNKLKCLIEYQGIQHYQSIDYFGGEEKFKIQQKYDNKKRIYCKNHNIPLIEFSYDEKEKINKEYIMNKIGGYLNE